MKLMIYQSLLSRLMHSHIKTIRFNLSIKQSTIFLESKDTSDKFLLLNTDYT